MAIRIVEVGPRDGLQNEAAAIPLDVKVRFIEALAAAGLTEIEAASFVSPKWVPQMADADTLWAQLPPGPSYSALVPNRKGLDRALAAGVGSISLFTAASEAFSRANINMTIYESLVAAREVAAMLRQQTPRGSLRAYVSTAFECPFSGRTPVTEVVRVVERLLEIGVDEISIADTVGRASPKEVLALGRALATVLPHAQTAFHFHDTNGTALANVCAAMELGYRVFDASAGGLGGCPYSPGSTGNLATEDLVYLLLREGLECGVDLELLSRASLEILNILKRGPAAKAQVAALSRSSEAPCAM